MSRLKGTKKELKIRKFPKFLGKTGLPRQMRMKFEEGG